MIDFNFYHSCTGCQACADACPPKCISFIENKEGFWMPIVNPAACIDCKRCERVCPALHNEVEPFNNHKCYVAYHLDENVRHDGSSGSVFYALAEYIICQGGVVYGAAFDANLQLLHKRVTSMTDLQPLMKSKYIQSNTRGIYIKVLEDLQNSLPVLFVGTPCQCRALHNIISVPLRENLLIVDILCHGVPSQELFKMSLKQFEKKHSCKVTDFSFREKTPNKLRNYKITYQKTDGKIYSLMGDSDAFPYCLGFFNHLTWRNSCYHCRQRGVERVSDFTLGDFWGIDEIRPEVKDFVKGYSSVITNTEKGNRIMEYLKGLHIVEIPEGVEYTRRHNHAYVYPDKKSIERNMFFWALRHFGYAFCEKHFLQHHPSLADRLHHSLIIRIDKIIQHYIWKRK